MRTNEESVLSKIINVNKKTLSNLNSLNHEHSLYTFKAPIRYALPMFLMRCNDRVMATIFQNR